MIVKDSVRIVLAIAELGSFQKAAEELGYTGAGIRHMDTGTIQVAAFNSVSVLWLPGIIAQFRQVYPEGRIEIVMYDDDLEGWEMLRRGEADCGIYVTPVESDLKIHPLAIVPIVAIVSPSDPLAERDSFPVEELGNHPYVAGCGEKMIEDIFVTCSHHLTSLRWGLLSQGTERFQYL